MPMTHVHVHGAEMAIDSTDWTKPVGLWPMSLCMDLNGT